MEKGPGRVGGIERSLMRKDAKGGKNARERAK